MKAEHLPPLVEPTTAPDGLAAASPVTANPWAALRQLTDARIALGREIGRAHV